MSDRMDKGRAFLNAGNLEYYYDEEENAWGNTEDGVSVYFWNDGSWGEQRSDGIAFYYGADYSWGGRGTDGYGIYFESNGHSSLIVPEDDLSEDDETEEDESEFYGVDEETEEEPAEEDTEETQGRLMRGLETATVLLETYADRLESEKMKRETDTITYEMEKYQKNRVKYITKELERGQKLKEHHWKIVKARLERQRKENLKAHEKRAKAEEKERQKQARKAELRERRKEFRRNHWKGIVVAVLVIALATAGGGFFWYYSSLVPMSVSPSDAQKMTYKQLEKALWDNGYIRVYCAAENDLDYVDLKQEGQVIEMTVDGNKDFKRGKRFPEDVNIDIKYHSAKKIKPPASAKELKGKSYKKAVAAFKKQGFGNIKTKGEKDSFITKWMNNEGEVKQVTVGGDEDYSTSTNYRVDEKIVITYHEK